MGKDVYPAQGEYTTNAMAEGAIEGDASQYEMPSPFATSFAYSRFGLESAPPRNTSKFVGEANIYRPRAYSYTRLHMAGQCCRQNAYTIKSGADNFASAPEGCQKPCDADPTCVGFDHST